MKLSKGTIDILKNFSSINSNLCVKTGNTLLTMSPNKSVVAQAVVVEEFEQDFGIFNLSEFLGVFNLFKDPELEFAEKFLTFKESRNRIRYAFAESELLTYPPKGVTMPDTKVSFTLRADDLSKILKTSGVIGAPDIEFRGSEGHIVAVLQDVSNEYCNQLEIDLETETDQEFHVFLKVENIKMLPGEYTVNISSKRIIEFINEERAQKYWVAAEQNSVFK